MTIAHSPPRHAVILCHPDADSFNATVARRYCDVVREIGQVTVLRDLYRIGFDPILQSDERRQTDEAAYARDVGAEIELIRDADVFVLIYPIWFGTPPAMLKGYVERVFGAGFDHRAIHDRSPHAFMAGKHLLSLSSSGNSIQWLEGQGAWLSLRTVFDNYLATAFSMDSTEHTHFSNIVDGLTQQTVDEEMQRVTEIARKTCARFVGGPSDKRTRPGSKGLVSIVSEDSMIAVTAKNAS
jgi:NAD(P)H dehydrogenase (quinone)